MVGWMNGWMNGWIAMQSVQEFAYLPVRFCPVWRDEEVDCSEPRVIPRDLRTLRHGISKSNDITGIAAGGRTAPPLRVPPLRCLGRGVEHLRGNQVAVATKKRGVAEWNAQVDGDQHVPKP